MNLLVITSSVLSNIKKLLSCKQIEFPPFSSQWREFLVLEFEEFLEMNPQNVLEIIADVITGR